jgi:thymidine phosphorylase
VFADDGGFITAIDTKAVGTAVVALGGGRQGAEDSINPAVGVSGLQGLGVKVDSGIPLAVIHAAHEDSWEHAAKLLKSGFRIGRTPVEALPVIHRRVEGENSNATQ